MHCGRTGRAGILHAARALEAQIGRSLQYEGSRKILGGEARIEMAEHDLVHVARGNAGISKSLLRHPHNEALDRFFFEPSERSMRPPDDATGHRCLLSSGYTFVHSQRLWSKGHTGHERSKFRRFL